MGESIYSLVSLHECDQCHNYVNSNILVHEMMFVKHLEFHHTKLKAIAHGQSAFSDYSFCKHSSSKQKSLCMHTQNRRFTFMT